MRPLLAGVARGGLLAVSLLPGFPSRRLLFWSDRLSLLQLLPQGRQCLLSKSFQLSGEVYLAMQSRGFRGEVYVLDEFEMKQRDWAAFALVLATAAAAVWAGR